MRALNIAAFAVSGYASTEGRQCKPFNPLLGETYEADYPDKGLRFFSEKVDLLFPTNSCISHNFLSSRQSMFWISTFLFRDEYKQMKVEDTPICLLSLVSPPPLSFPVKYDVKQS